jgi:hypothetical protein
MAMKKATNIIETFYPKNNEESVSPDPRPTNIKNNRKDYPPLK